MKRNIKIILALIIIFAIILTAQENIPNIFALIRANNTQEVKKLISQEGFDINIQDANGNTPLMHAILKRNQQMVQLIIEAKANVNIKNKDGLTALIFALTNRNDRIFNMIIESGADIEIKDNDGNTDRKSVV